MHSLPTLGRITRERLSSLLLSPTIAPTIAVIDVRDDDYVGGHISSSMHVPSSSLDYRIPELVRKLAGKQVVVFHCALSQQRGPSAALRYLRERGSRALAAKSVDESGQDKENGQNEKSGKEVFREDIGVEGEKQEDREAAVLKDVEPGREPRNTSMQEVYILDGGFVKWQELYVFRESLTGLTISPRNLIFGLCISD